MSAVADWRPAGLLGDLAPGELNDACCWACSGGGDVVCCDGCRAVYHLACINLQSLPSEDFFCPLCSCHKCQGPCTIQHPALAVQTDWIPVNVKNLPVRESPQAKLPEETGYVCPQQLRMWMQQPQQQQQLAVALEAGTDQQKEANSSGDGAVATEAAEPKPKRQKREPGCAPTGSSSTSTAANTTHSSNPAAIKDALASQDAYLRCCSCQRSCHIRCLPAEQQQQLAAWAAEPQDSPGKDQQKPSRTARRIRSPRQAGKLQPQHEQDEQQRQQEQERQLQQWLSRPVPAYFCSPGCKQMATELAQQCARGVVQLDSLADGTPICWQLIQPAAVASALAKPPAAVAGSTAGVTAVEAKKNAAAQAALDDSTAAEARSVLSQVFAGAVPPPAFLPAAVLLGTGAAPAYPLQQAVVLSQVLKDTQQLMWQQLGPVWEVRTYQHCLPWLLSGLRQPCPGGLVDLSTVHVAVLWAGSTLAAAALLRVYGGEGGVLETTLAAVSPLLQHRQLGRMLLSAVERFAMGGCGVKQAWMPALGGVVKPCVGVSLLPGWELHDDGRGRLQLAPGCSTKQLGLDSSSGSSAGGPAAGGSTQQAAEDAVQRVPKGVAACWALRLSYGRAANVTDWLHLTRCPLLRYSYVPFVSKRLEPNMMLPVPCFPKQQAVHPPPLPPLPPHMQPQPYFAMQPMPQPRQCMQQVPHELWMAQQHPMMLCPPMQQQQHPSLPTGAEFTVDGSDSLHAAVQGAMDNAATGKQQPRNTMALQPLLHRRSMESRHYHSSPR